LVFWLLFGWLADYSFPFGQALELMLACFNGTVSSKINTLQKQLQQADVTASGKNIQQVKKLNNLESQAWLYKSILDRLGNDSSVNHEKIALSIEALEYKRHEILRKLEPQRPKSYRVLARVQDSAREILVSQAEKDYEQLEKIVNNLAAFTKRRQPSQTILSKVIKQLAIEISQSSNQISPYRLRLAYKIDELMKLLSARLIVGSPDSEKNSMTDSDYQAINRELNARIRILSNQFNRLLEIRRENVIKVESRSARISNLNRSISELHRTISNYEADLVASRQNAQELRKSIQNKQDQIDELKTLIATQQKDIQSSAEVSRSQEEQNTYLHNYLSRLKQDKSILQKQIEDINGDIQRKNSEIISLQNEKLRSSSQKLTMQRENERLRQHSQQKEDDIANLNKQIQDLARTSKLKPKSSLQDTSKLPTVKTFATSSRISAEEYQRIDNKGDYVYVKEYRKKNGTLVKHHYRKPPKKGR
jgi:predicted  nucleic acid-binding Zn-ribbon protein